MSAVTTQSVTDELIEHILKAAYHHYHSPRSDKRDDRLRNELKPLIGSTELKESTLTSRVTELEKQVQLLREACRVARRTMQNTWQDKPRLGMEGACKTVDEALAATESKEE